MIAPTRLCSGASTGGGVENVPARRSAVQRSTAAQKPSVSPNWYCTAPQVAPMSLAMRLADTEPGSPEDSERRAASSMLSRVALPRGLGPGPAIPAPLACRVIRRSYPLVAGANEKFHRGRFDMPWCGPSFVREDAADLELLGAH